MDPTVTTSADGTVTVTAEVELDLPEDDAQVAPEQPEGDPMADIIGGAFRGVGKVLGGLWDAIKPDDSPPADPEEE